MPLPPPDAPRPPYVVFVNPRSQVAMHTYPDPLRAALQIAAARKDPVAEASARLRALAEGPLPEMQRGTLSNWTEQLVDAYEQAIHALPAKGYEAAQPKLQRAAEDGLKRFTKRVLDRLRAYESHPMAQFTVVIAQLGEQARFNIAAVTEFEQIARAAVPFREQLSRLTAAVTRTSAVFPEGEMSVAYIEARAARVLERLLDRDLTQTLAAADRPADQRRQYLDQLQREIHAATWLGDVLRKRYWARLRDASATLSPSPAP